jgi:hypothetical protein
VCSAVPGGGGACNHFLFRTKYPLQFLQACAFGHPRELVHARYDLLRREPSASPVKCTRKILPSHSSRVAAMPPPQVRRGDFGQGVSPCDLLRIDVSQGRYSHRRTSYVCRKLFCMGVLLPLCTAVVHTCEG